MLLDIFVCIRVFKDIFFSPFDDFQDFDIFDYFDDFDFDDIDDFNDFDNLDDFDDIESILVGNFSMLYILDSRPMKVAVIGGGVSGLSTAWTLAKFGHKGGVSLLIVYEPIKLIVL